MGWFTKKCPQCDGALEATGYSAPYPAYRCNNCIDNHKRATELAELRARVDELENSKTTA